MPGLNCIHALRARSVLCLLYLHMFHCKGFHFRQTACMGLHAFPRTYLVTRIGSYHEVCKHCEDAIKGEHIRQAPSPVSFP